MWLFNERRDLFISIAAGLPVLIYFSFVNIIFHFRKKGVPSFLYRNMVLIIPNLYLISRTIVEKF